MRPIKGYEGLFSITEDGRIFCHKTNKYRNPYKNNSGYLSVGLYKKGVSKRLLVHRLVAEAFVPNSNGCKEINHKDGNKENNHFSNIEWSDRSKNMLHAIHILHSMPSKRGENSGRTWLTREQVIAIRQDRANGLMYKEIAPKYGMSSVNIGRICNGQRWNDLELCKKVEVK